MEMIAERIEVARDILEKVMSELPTDQPPEMHKNYLRGYVDCLLDTRQITEAQHKLLYVQYGH